MHEILPGILEKDWSEIERKLETVRPFAKSIHVDIIDGKFAPNTTFLDPKPFAKYAKDFFLELHMMVDDPLVYLEPFAAAGFQRFLGHIEEMPDQAAFVAKAQHYGEVGLVLDGPTPLDAINVPLADLDTLLIFTAEKAGFSGQPFQEDRLEKIKQLHEELPFLPLEVDGGTSQQTITQSAKAGATRFVATSALFTSGNSEEAYHALSSLVT